MGTPQRTAFFAAARPTDAAALRRDRAGRRHRTHLGALLVLLVNILLSSTGAGFASEEGCAIDPALVTKAGAERRISEVVDGDTVRLDRPVDGAAEVRLVGLQAPKLALGRPGFDAWPLAEDAKAQLESLVGDHALRLVSTGTALDRHGRLLAHLVRDDGLWIQGEMLRRGFARVYTFADNRALADRLYACERQARAARRGIWTDAFYAIRTPDDAGADVGRFAVVEGTVQSVSRVKQKVYVNFGNDWRTDFTVVVPTRLADSFRDAGLDLENLEGRRIRVRGWIEKYNGPMIEATHPEQFETGIGGQPG